MKDKILHFVCCMAVALVVSTIMANIMAASYPARPVVAAACCCVAGLLAGFFCGMGKEYGDHCHGGKFDRLDLLADFAGALVGCNMGWALLGI